MCDHILFYLASQLVKSIKQMRRQTLLSKVPSFPLLSDQGSLLAQLWGVPGAPVTEEEEDMGEVETRAVVITDNKAVMLEIISSSMSSEELVQYTKDRVDMLVEKRRRAVDREYREQCERVEQSVEMEIKLGN